MKSLETDPETRCPSCNQSLRVENNAAYCLSCDLYLDNEPTPGKRLAGYALSLPERVARLAVGSVAGIVKGASEILLPEAIRHTQLYRVLLDKNLRYLIKDVGAVEDVYVKTASAPSNYVARKFVGNFVELSGILTLHASPVWILALISDISGGTKTFLKEFAEALKQEGLLDPDANVQTADQLLQALQSFSGKIADEIDTPPLSVEELRQTLQYFRNESRALKLQHHMKHEDMQSLLEDMKDVARKEKKSLFEISAAMAMSTINQLERSGRKAATGLRVGQALLDRTIFQHYSQSLKDVSRLGYYRHLSECSKPYLKAVARHLAWRNVSWTERYFLKHTRIRIRSNRK